MSRKKVGASPPLGWTRELAFGCSPRCSQRERDAQRERVLSFDSRIVRVHRYLPAHWLVAR